MNIIQEPPFGLQNLCCTIAHPITLQKKKKKDYFSLLSIKKIIDNTVNIVRSTNNEIKNDSFDSEVLPMQSQHLLV